MHGHMNVKKIILARLPGMMWAGDEADCSPLTSVMVSRTEDIAPTLLPQHHYHHHLRKGT